ncbi:MAG: 5,10-methylenetetrahydrofolate reductase [Candidatus Omnitrophica bacterium]|nr:5,10-methylenetetrahydrofolate reductase [Candidatus Omnitrophota bacterium]
MIITKQREFQEILKNLQNINKVFLVGCGECATTCKSGGEPEILEIKKKLEEQGKTVTGFVVPEAPCIASQAKTALAKNIKALKEAEAILVMACGLGAQSVKANDRRELLVFPGCDTLFAGAVDSDGVFQELCSACGECVLDLTGGICPLTRCPKGLLNGPCGGMNKGKCEVDKDRDCAWVLIYNELKKKGRLELFSKAQPAKNYSKTTKPRKLVLSKGSN